MSKSSWWEYVGDRIEGKDGICEKGITLGQFKSRGDYRKFAEGSLEDIIERKELYKKLEASFLE